MHPFVTRTRLEIRLRCHEVLATLLIIPDGGGVLNRLSAFFRAALDRPGCLKNLAVDHL